MELEARNIEVAEKARPKCFASLPTGAVQPGGDVIEAENDLLDARNAWGQARIDYELQRMQRLRNLGLLEVAADGTLVEKPVATAEAEPAAPVPVPEFEVPDE